MIYVLIFASKEEIISSNTMQKFSVLMSSLRLYTKPTVIMKLCGLRSANIVSMPFRVKISRMLFWKERIIISCPPNLFPYSLHSACRLYLFICLISLSALYVADAKSVYGGKEIVESSEEVM